MISFEAWSSFYNPSMAILISTLISSSLVKIVVFYRFSGYLFVKVGKIAACSLGTTLLLIQVHVVLIISVCDVHFGPFCHVMTLFALQSLHGGLLVGIFWL